MKICLNSKSKIKLSIIIYNSILSEFLLYIQTFVGLLGFCTSISVFLKYKWAWYTSQILLICCGYKLAGKKKRKRKKLRNYEITVYQTVSRVFYSS